MPTLAEVVRFCDERTRRHAWKDHPNALNGLNLENDGRVTRLGAAVDAGRVPFARAAAAGIDFLIVHHGRQVHVLNAPSPAATSSFEIATHIVSHLPE